MWPRCHICRESNLAVFDESVAVAMRRDDETAAILDDKWKRPDLGEPNSGVSSGDAYQMSA